MRHEFWQRRYADATNRHSNDTGKEDKTREKLKAAVQLIIEANRELATASIFKQLHP